MPRLALVARTLALPDERRHLADRAWLAALLERGEFQNDVPGRFTGGYGATPDEIAPLMEAAGFATVSVTAAESVARGLPNVLGGDLDETVIDVLERLAGEPSVLGLASHLLYVGRR